MFLRTHSRVVALSLASVPVAAAVEAITTRMLEYDRPLGLFAGVLVSVSGYLAGFRAGRRASDPAELVARLHSIMAALSLLGLACAALLVPAARLAGLGTPPFPTTLFVILPAGVVALGLGCFAGVALHRVWLALGWMLVWPLILLAHSAWQLTGVYHIPSNLLLGIAPWTTATENAWVQSLPSPHLVLRGVALLFGAAWLELSLWIVSRRSEARAPRPTSVVLARRALLATTLACAFVFPDASGIGSGRRTLERVLPEAAQGSVCVVRYAEGLFTDRQRERVVDDCDWTWQRLARSLDTVEHDRGERLLVWAFADSGQMQSFLGAHQGAFANSGEVFTTFEASRDTLRSLRHELAHVHGRRLRRAGSRQPIPTALIEGFAVTLDRGYHVEPAMQAAFAAALERGCMPRLRRLLESRTLRPYRRLRGDEYEWAGSFCAFVIDHYGFESFCELYRSGDYERALGRGVDELEAEWRDHLTGIEAAQDDRRQSFSLCPPPDEDSGRASSIAQRPDILAEIRRLEATRDWEGALRYARETLERESPQLNPLRLILAVHRAFRGLERHREALSWLVEAESMYPEQISVLRTLQVRQCATLGLWDRGRELLASSRLPAWREIWESVFDSPARELAVKALDAGTPHESIRLLERAVEVDPCLASLYRHTAVRFAPLLREAHQRELLERSLGMRCPAAGTPQIETLERLAELAERGDDLASALEYVGRALAIEADAETRYRLAEESDRIRFRLARGIGGPVSPAGREGSR